MLHPRPPFPRMPINRMIPNILTMLALCAGMTAMRFGLQGRWGAAVLAILVAAILDALDGRIARLLKGTSKFGAELDSLSDFICFGVAPAIMLYLWAMQEAGRVGWVLALLYAVCCALRLARFNTALGQSDLPPWSVNFFTGVPAPMAAGLVLLPMILWLQFRADALREPGVVGFFQIAVAALMVSRLPTFSFKKIKVPAVWVLPTMLIVGLFAASLVTAPWLTMSAVLIVYIGSMPFSLRSFRALKRRHDERDHADGAAAPPASGA